MLDIAFYRNDSKKYDFSNLDLYSRMYPAFEEIKAYVDGNPDKPFLLCELLCEYCHSMGNGPGDFEDYFELFQKNECMCGALSGSGATMLFIMEKQKMAEAERTESDKSLCLGGSIMNAAALIEKMELGEYDALLTDLYVDTGKLKSQKDRYRNAVRSFERYYGKGEVAIFSAPGRSEIGGNHTDHQHGEVLAASVNLDTIGVVKQTADRIVKVISEGYEEVTISLDNLEPRNDEKETTTALVKGVLAGMKERGYKIGGFRAYITSDVLIGAGLSSSAAYETLIGTIISGLYNDMSVPSIEIAIIGQYAENVYFGKPCGLMDQMACSVGNLVHIDFAEPDDPVVEKVSFHMEEYGYSLCITDTKGSHADLTADYAAVPKEMKSVAAYFGKDVLFGISKEDIFTHMTQLREKTGDRAVLRALHFIGENERVRQEVAALKEKDMDAFLELVRESGDSSYKYLQNVYSNGDVQHQNVSLALALSEMFLGGRGVSRVHGGGFAGTIQAFVQNSEVEAYKKHMDAIFGTGSCVGLKIRKYGGIKVL